ncbi:MAG: nucleotide sugar dehydrogenase, partial [Actinobacteria bacterium]
MGFTRDLAIVGGCGRVGLPLGIAFAEAGLTVTLYDHDDAAVDRVRAGKMPFREEGADQALERVTGSGALIASTEPAVVSEAANVVIVVGTPVD